MDDDRRFIERGGRKANELAQPVLELAEQEEVAEILTRANAIFSAASSPKVYLWAIGQFSLKPQHALAELDENLVAAINADRTGKTTAHYTRTVTASIAEQHRA